MSKEGLSFEAWLEKARLRRERLNDRQLAVLEAAYRLLEDGGHDYASRRLVEHLLLHADLGLKVAQVARLVDMDRCTSSRHRRCSSAQVVQAIPNRQAGKFPGKLLPRYAGPVAQFLLEQPHATRDEIIDFLERRWQIRPGYRALDNFLRKYGLDRRTLHTPASADAPVAASAEDAAAAEAEPHSAAAIAWPSDRQVLLPSPAEIRVLAPSPRHLSVPPPADFFWPTPSTRVRS